jgi:hypothetical protein
MKPRSLTIGLCLLAFGPLAILGTTGASAQNSKSETESLLGDQKIGGALPTTATTVQPRSETQNIPLTLQVNQAITKLRRAHLLDWGGVRFVSKYDELPVRVEVAVKAGSKDTLTDVARSVGKIANVQLVIKEVALNEVDQALAVRKILEPSGSSGYFDPFENRLVVSPPVDSALSGTEPASAIAIRSAKLQTSVQPDLASSGLAGAQVVMAPPQKIVATAGGETVNGVAQTGQGLPICTSGWGIYRPVSVTTGYAGYMTAGHCQALGTPLPQASGSTTPLVGYQIQGPILNSAVSNVMQSRRTDNYWDHVAVMYSGSWNTWTGTVVVDMSAVNAHLAQGQYVCWWGQATNAQVCGTTGAVNVDANLTGNLGVPGSPYHLWLFTLPGACKKGDSGGPVWLPPAWFSPNSPLSQPLGYVSRANMLSSVVAM